MLDSYMVIEAIDHVWLGGKQPGYLKRECAFEFETPCKEGSDLLFNPALLWNSNNMVMATMPRKISFYLITGGKTTLCFVFLETIAQTKLREETACTSPLLSRTGSTVIWQQNPPIRGMYFMYFLFDCFGVYEPPPWDPHAYHSYLEKQENNRKLASDGWWTICTFFRTLGALTEFTITGWNERLSELSKLVESAFYQKDIWLANELHKRLDDLFFHHEKSKLHIRLGKVILDDEREEYSSDIRYFLLEHVRSSEYKLQSFDLLEKKIQNNIEHVRALSYSNCFVFQVPILGTTNTNLFFSELEDAHWRDVAQNQL